MDDFRVSVDGVELAGRVCGRGEPVLVLHGGPALGFEYVEPVLDELAGTCRVAVHQQRGLSPSRTEGPFAVRDHVADVRRVLDALGWPRAALVGHSWGAHLALHVARELPSRVTAVLAVEPWGAVGDGGTAAFVAELEARTPEADLRRAEELDERMMRDEATPEEVQESIRLTWPAYFAVREAAPPMPETRFEATAYAATMESATEMLPVLEASLPEIAVPVGFVAGAASPMPLTASTATAERIPGAWVTELEGAGHFVWHERPGAVREALVRLLDGG